MVLSFAITLRLLPLNVNEQSARTLPLESQIAVADDRPVRSTKPYFCEANSEFTFSSDPR